MICVHAPTDAGVGSAGGRSSAEPPRTNGVASECHGAIFSQKKFVIFPDAVLLVEAENSALHACPAKIEAGGRLPTGTRCRISCLQLSTTAC